MIWCWIRRVIQLIRLDRLRNDAINAYGPWPNEIPMQKKKKFSPPAFNASSLDAVIFLSMQSGLRMPLKLPFKFILYAASRISSPVNLNTPSCRRRRNTYLSPSVDFSMMLTFFQFILLWSWSVSHIARHHDDHRGAMTIVSLGYNLLSCKEVSGQRIELKE